MRLVKKQPIINRLMSKVVRIGDCLIWTGSRKHDGYGVIKINDHNVNVHRVSYALFNGPIEGKFVCHKCDNPPCIEPSHLFLGGHLENSNDKVLKGRQHRLPGVKNPSAKLTDIRVKNLRAIAKYRILPWREIGEMFGISTAQAYSVANYKTWKHVE